MRQPSPLGSDHNLLRNVQQIGRPTKNRVIAWDCGDRASQVEALGLCIRQASTALRECAVGSEVRIVTKLSCRAAALNTSNLIVCQHHLVVAELILMSLQSLTDTHGTANVPSSHYYLRSLSRTSRTFYFPDSRDLLQVLGGLPWQRERETLGRMP